MARLDIWRHGKESERQTLRVTHKLEILDQRWETGAENRIAIGLGLG